MADVSRRSLLRGFLALPVALKLAPVVAPKSPWPMVFTCDLGGARAIVQPTPSMLRWVVHTWSEADGTVTMRSVPLEEFYRG